MALLLTPSLLLRKKVISFTSRNTMKLIKYKIKTTENNTNTDKESSLRLAIKHYIFSLPNVHVNDWLVWHSVHIFEYILVGFPCIAQDFFYFVCSERVNFLPCICCTKLGQKILIFKCVLPTLQLYNVLLRQLYG